MYQVQSGPVARNHDNVDDPNPADDNKVQFNNAMHMWVAIDYQMLGGGGGGGSLPRSIKQVIYAGLWVTFPITI